MLPVLRGQHSVPGAEGEPGGARARQGPRRQGNGEGSLEDRVQRTPPHGVHRREYDRVHQ